MAKVETNAARILIGGFVVALLALFVWFAVDLGGLMPGDSAVLTPNDTPNLLLNSDAPVSPNR
jgi:hypothetical protein